MRTTRDFSPVRQLHRFRDFVHRLRCLPWWSWILLGAVAIFLFVSGYAAYDGRRISGQVQLEQIDRPDDVRELAAFMARLKEIQKWQPYAANPDRLTLVARFANLPSNRQYSAFSDLLRTAPKDGPTLNDSIELLSRPATNSRLSKLRQDDIFAFAQSMRKMLESTIETDRDAAFAVILRQEKSQKLIRRLEIIEPAGEPGKLGWLWRTAFNQTLSNRADWVNELLESGTHVKRLADWYMCLEQASDLPLEVNERGAGLWFSRHFVGGIEYDGFNSTLNGQLQLRVPESKDATASMRVFNTGVEINGLKIEPHDQSRTASVRIRYLPAPTVAPDQLSRALNQLGLPNGFSLTNIKCNREKQRYMVSFTAVSRVLENCHFDWQWSLGGQTLDEIKKGLGDLPRKARATFDQALGQTTRYGDWRVRFELAGQDFVVAKLPLGTDELSFSVTSAGTECRGPRIQPRF